MKPRLWSWMSRRVALKLSLTMALIVIIVQLTFSYFEVVSNKVQMEADLASKESTLGDIVANAFPNAVWNYNDIGAETIASSILKDRDVASIKVVGSMGTLMYAHKKLGTEYNGVYLKSKTIPINYMGDQIGLVTIEFTDYFLIRQVQNNTVVKLLETIFTTIILIGAIMLVSFRITKPIKLLSSGTDEIAAGNLQKQIHVGSSDEIGELAGKFNKMTTSLYQMMEEREKARAALEASEEKFSKAFQSSADIIGIVRLEDQHFVDISDSFFENFGYERSDVIENTSKDFGLWCNPHERALFYEKVYAHDSNQKMEARWRTRSGEIRDGILAINRITISNELCLIFVWHDITERQRAEEALQLAHDQLEIKVNERTKDLIALNENLRGTNEELFNTLEVLKKTQAQLIKSEKMASLGTLVAGVAHEINTPVGIAVTAITYLNDLHMKFERQYKSGEMKRQDVDNYLSKSDETIRMIVNNLDRAGRLVHSFKKVSVDQSTESKRTFAVKQYLDELLMSLHPRLKKSNQNVVIECPQSLEIESYPGAFAQIITNLIMNSLIHAYEPNEVGEMVISVMKDGDDLHIKYTDDGKGMDPMTQEKIFDPFFTTKRLEGGTGLGLHVIYNIITLQLGGTIECQSELQKGTQFHISFPLKNK